MFMKKTVLFSGFLSILFLLNSCTKTESDFTAVPPPVSETIKIESSSLSVTTGTSVDFTIISSINNSNITSQSKIFVNGTEISGKSYTFSSAGNYTVYATKGFLTSNNITVAVTMITAPPNLYVHNVLVEEYSGTWCGNCPRLLYGVDLLHQQTPKAFVVGIHLFGGDPFISSDGNNLASMRGVSGVPTGHINRTKSWTGPQYENVPQVINEIKPSATVGLAISSTLLGNILNVSVKIAYKEAVAGNTKLTVYLVEDKLNYTQRNYSSNLYGGLAYIPNFNYNAVLRSVISALAGDNIPNYGIANEKTYTLALPSNILNTANVVLLAFVTDAAGNVLNVQQAKAGTIKDFERL